MGGGEGEGESEKWSSPFYAFVVFLQQYSVSYIDHKADHNNKTRF